MKLIEVGDVIEITSKSSYVADFVVIHSELDDFPIELINIKTWKKYNGYREIGDITELENVTDNFGKSLLNCMSESNKDFANEELIKKEIHTLLTGKINADLERYAEQCRKEGRF